MISSIELKSQDFDDENFSPVFNRKTQEFFLEPSEKFKNDHNKVIDNGSDPSMLFAYLTGFLTDDRTS